MFDDLLPEIEKSIQHSTGSMPVVFKGIERQFAKGESQPKSNRHEFHELLYMKSGKAQFDIAGRMVFVEKGDTLVIRPQKTHKITVNEGSADMVVLYFGFKSASERRFEGEVSRLTIEQFIQFANGTDTIPSQDEITEPYFTIKGRSRQDIASIVDRILRENKSDAYGKELMMQFLTMELLVALSRGLREEWEESIRVKSGKIHEMMRFARDYFVENHDKDISVADVAAYVFLSPGYFTRVFRDETGINPINFLTQVRVDHACRLLEQNELKVGGIAEMVGFASAQRFNTAFRKHCGISPLVYRNQYLIMKQRKPFRKDSKSVDRDSMSKSVSKSVDRDSIAPEQQE